MRFSERIYDTVLLATSALIAPFFLFHSRGQRSLPERFGQWNLSRRTSYTWFHGASNGEIGGLLPFIEEWKRQVMEQDEQVLITATSPTGLDRARDVADTVRLLPFDTSPFLLRALRAVQVKNFIISETELWPTLLRIVQEKGIRVSLINARLSDKAFSHYRRFSFFWKPVLQSINTLCAANEEAAERFAALGVSPDHIHVTGNTKYDFIPTVSSEEESKRLREMFFGGQAGAVLVLGSLRPGEEKFWFPAIAQYAQESDASLLTVIAPRHQEKFDFFAAQLQQHSVPFQRWSEIREHEEVGERGRTILLDTFGDLQRVYSFADVAFVGGTMVPIGGHNVLEPAMYGAAVCFGNSIENVRDIAQQLKDEDAYFPLESAQDVQQVLSRLFTDRENIRCVGERGRAVWQAHQGAVQRTLAILSQRLAEKKEMAS